MNGLAVTHGILLLALLPLGGQIAAARHALTEPAASPPAFRDVQVHAVSLDDLDTEGVQVVVHVIAVANADATLDHLVFDRATVDGLPLNLPPLAGPIQLKKDEPLLTLPPVRARLNFRELNSLQPLRRMIDGGSARFRAQLRSRVSLGLFARLALRTTSAWVVTAVDQEVPVELPGGSLGRLSGLGLLTVADPVWRLGRAVQARHDVAMASRASAALRGSLLALETCYRLKTRSGETALVSLETMAFAVDASTILAPAEAIQPWLFDADIAEGLARGDVTLVPSSVDIKATPVRQDGTADVYALSRRNLRVVKTLEGKQVAVSHATRRRFDLRVRGSDSNLALLSATRWTGTRVEPLVGIEEFSWQPATVVRLRRNGSRTDPVFLQTAVRLASGRLELRDAIDSNAFGSPIWTERGIVGVVQSHTSGADIKEAMRALDVQHPRRTQP